MDRLCAPGYCTLHHDEVGVIRMRTTLNIDHDVLLAAKSIARGQGRSVGSVISELARQGLAGKSVDYSQGCGSKKVHFTASTPSPNEALSLRMN